MYVAPLPRHTLQADAIPAIQTISNSDWEPHRTFQSGHAGDVTAAAWSANGALLASAGADRSLTLWDTRSQKILKS